MVKNEGEPLIMKSHKYIKRDPYKDCFIVQNDIFNMGLCPGEIAIYVLLLKLDGNNNGYCLITYSSIKLYIDLGIKTVKKYVKSLEAKNIIKITPASENIMISFKQRDRRKEFFLLPNEVMGIGLSAGEIAVYAYLVKCEDHNNYQCYPSYRTIGKNIGASVNSVKKYVDALDRKNLIFTEHTSIMTQDLLKLNGNMKYTILPFDEALSHYYDNKIADMKRRRKMEKFDML